jgi:N-methylhydantoinase A
MSSHSSEMCIGIDVGGTFTDAVMTDGRGIWRAKSLTTPEDLGSGVIEACRLAAERAGRTLEGVIPTLRRFGLGTTAVTNVLATRRGRRIGLITTKGFEDLVPMARGRTFPEDGRLVPPPELVSRRHIIGVAERIDRNGQVLVTLDPEEVVRAARILVEQGGVEALAVSFLWSFLNPLHEDAAVEAIFEVFPDLLVVSGAAVHPQIREFERTNVALLNAYTSGAFKGIDALETKLRTMGLPVPILVVHSGGGSITTGEARRFPIGLAESGPAAGVAAAAMVADAANVSDVIACDLGGTSFEVAVISGGEIMRRSRSEVMGIYTAISVVDVESIGAGGGSIGWMDALGMLRVGPHSAGANPGPACYGRGGQEPTVTDALVVLGFIDPERFLGGDLQLDADGARVACETLGTKLGMDYEETAWGIREIALSGMVKAVQSRLAARGLDPRSHAMFSYGGCGALFCPDLARMISSRVVIVPELASVLSGFGAATTDVRRERVRSVLATLPIDMVSVEKICAELCAEVLPAERGAVDPLSDRSP